MSLPLEDFTSALNLAHAPSEAGADDTGQQSRLAAENFLMQLQNSPEGLNLAFHIISNEEIDALRAFWAFNTVKHHLPALSPQLSGDQAHELYVSLFSWLYRACRNNPLPPDYLLNKHAQVMVVGVQCFFPDRWSSYFNDMFAFYGEVEKNVSQGADCSFAVLYFLRVFEYVDERVVNKNLDRSHEERQRDMAIKDAMRSAVIEPVVATWYRILCDYRTTNVEICRVCLGVLETYIDWIDFQLIIAPDWINLLYFFLTVTNLRCGGCECLGMIVEKKQLPLLKYQTLLSIRVVEALPKIVELVMERPPASEEEEAFLIAVITLTVVTMREVLQCVEKGGPQEAIPLLHQVFLQVLVVFTARHFRAKEIILPLLQQYSKSQLLTQEEATQLLHSLYRETVYSEEDLLRDVDDTADQLIEQRKAIHNLLRILHRRAQNEVEQHCGACLTQVLNACQQGACPGEEAEAALRYIYELGEGVKLDVLKDENSTWTGIVRAVLHSPIIQLPSSAAHLAYFELFDRYHLFFLHHREEIPLLLQQFVSSGAGIVNPHLRVRGRICYFFCHIVTALKREVTVHSAWIVQNISPALSTNSGSPLLPSDKCDLYEGLGAVLSVTDLSTCSVVAEDVVRHMQEVCAAGQQMTEAHAAAVGDDVLYLSYLAKGIGGAAATRMPESPPLTAMKNPMFPGGCGGGGDGCESGELQRSPATAVFMDVTRCVLEAMAIVGSSFIVRDRAVVFFQQIVNILESDSILFVERFLTMMISTTTLAEFPKILRVAYQFVNKIRRHGAEMVAKTLLPLVVEKVDSAGDVVMNLRAVHGVVSESMRESIEVYRQYYLLVHAIATTSCIAALSHAEAEGVLPTLMGHVISALYVNAELEIPKQALQVLARLTWEWCDCNSSNYSAMGATFEGFLMNQALPAVIDALTAPALDLRDAKLFFTVAECANLLKAIANTIGERGLFAVFALFTTGTILQQVQGVGVAAIPVVCPGLAHNDAYDFIGLVKDEPRVTGQVKAQMAKVFEIGQEKRRAVILQQQQQQSAIR